MFRSHSIAAVVSVFAAGTLFASCGGGAGPSGSPADNNVPHPLVRQFSPTLSPLDLSTRQANPTYTDPYLQVNTDPAYPGRICIFFQGETIIDPTSVFIAGNPALGIDLSALQILQYIPGTGNVPLEPAAVDLTDPTKPGVRVESDRIIFNPASLPLALGQYSIGIFGNLKSVEGDAVDKAPVFHSFTVGTADTILPVVVVTNPINGQQNVGAGVPPPAPPSNVPASDIADVRTTIFGPTSPDVIIRFSESIDAASISPNTISAVDAGAFVPGGGAPPPVIPAPGYPKLKSLIDQASLPSNSFEAVWRADPTQGGLPFGTQVEVTVIGQRNTPGGAILNSSPIKDRSGNPLDVTFKFQFQTIAPPDLPACPEPEFAIYYSTSDRVGVLDAINFKDIALTVLGQGPAVIARNVLPDRNNQIATKQNLGTSFDPLEISVDSRTDGATCHTFAYVQSFQGGQIVILNTRTMLPVALINTPAPGGLSNQTGFEQAQNVLLVTNSSANTLTEFNISNFLPGRQFLTGPIYIQNVAPTGNTPRAVSISAPLVPTIPGSFNREWTALGPPTPLVMYADFTDGVVNTTNLGLKTPRRQITLGTGASPNDISMTDCFGLNPILFAAISEGGAPGDGKVAYYIAGPGCQTGSTGPGRPDSIIGDLSGFDAPAGLDEVHPFSPEPFFILAESGSTANQIVTLGIVGGAFNLPRVVREFSTGANPTSVCHRAAWNTPGVNAICAFPVGSPPPPCFSHPVLFTPAPCQYFGAEIYPDGSAADLIVAAPSTTLYVCSRGAGRVDVLNMTSGAIDFYSPIAIPGVRYIGTTCSQ